MAGAGGAVSTAFYVLLVVIGGGFGNTGWGGHALMRFESLAACEAASAAIKAFTKRDLELTTYIDEMHSGTGREDLVLRQWPIRFARCSRRTRSPSRWCCR